MDSLSHLASNNNPLQKQCTGPCKQFLPATTEFFYSHKGAKYGVTSCCRTCVRAEYLVNREKKLAYEKERRQMYRIEHLSRAKNYYQSHRQERLTYQRSYRQTHLEETRVRDRVYVQKHPEVRRLHARNHDVRKRGNGGTHTVADIQKQYVTQKSKCYYCHTKLGEKYHVEHVIPLSRGGRNSPDNLVLACSACNWSKGKKLLHEWVEGGRLL